MTVLLQPVGNKHCYCMRYMPGSHACFIEICLFFFDFPVLIQLEN